MRIRFATMTLALLTIVGCTLTARDRLRHFFFEVPDETSAAESAPSGESIHAIPVEDRPALTLPPARFVSIHEPFASHDCQTCHNVNERMSVDQDMETTCGQCHDRYFGDDVGHGPVAGGECLICHDPHRSAFPALLLASMKESCVECHDAPEDLSQPAHAEPDASNCTRCHDPHFGEPPLLKPGIKAPSQSDKG